MRKGRQEGKKKKRPSVRLPVAPPSVAHRSKAAYRREKEKARLHREVLEGEPPEVETDEDGAGAREGDGSA